MTKVIEEKEKITFECEKCGNKVETARGIISLGCLNPGCQKSRIIFEQDVMRRPHINDIWQDCLAGVPMEVGYTNGTIMSKVYEVKRNDMVDPQSEEKEESEVKIENKKEAKLPKGGPLKRLRRESK